MKAIAFKKDTGHILKPQGQTSGATKAWTLLWGSAVAADSLTRPVTFPLRSSTFKSNQLVLIQCCYVAELPLRSMRAMTTARIVTAFAVWNTIAEV